MLGFDTLKILLSVPPKPVGGVVIQVDKLAIIAPYLVLVGLAAVASIIYIKKRRKN